MGPFSRRRVNAGTKRPVSPHHDSSGRFPLEACGPRKPQLFHHKLPSFHHLEAAQGRFRRRGLIFLMKMKGVNGSFLSFYRRLSPLVIFFQGKLEPGDGIKNERSLLPALKCGVFIRKTRTTLHWGPHVSKIP